MTKQITAKQIVRLKYEREIQRMNRRFPDLVGVLKEVDQLTDEVFKQLRVKFSNKQAVAVSQLGRICCRHFESIVYTSLAGHGFTSLRSLRSMYEKLVDAAYLAQHEDEVEDFWDYSLVELVLIGRTDLAERQDREYLRAIERFKLKNGQYRSRWSKRTIRERAQRVKLADHRFQFAYKSANPFVHSSISEVSNSFIIERDGSVSPATSDDHLEHDAAAGALVTSLILMNDVLHVMIAFFGLEETDRLKEFPALVEQMFKNEVTSKG